MSRIIFASHGDLSKGMKHSLSMIAGNLADQVETYGLYPGESPNDYYQQLVSEISNSDEQFIILCDIKGGSVHSALSQLTQFKQVVLLSGMNLPMALDVVLRYSDGIANEEYDAFVEGAKEGITLITKLEEESDDDF